MQWLHIVAYFFGGAFFVNAIPHFTNGVSGRRFPTPFASPPVKGLSSPTVNALWGSCRRGYSQVERKASNHETWQRAHCCCAEWRINPAELLVWLNDHRNF